MGCGSSSASNPSERFEDDETYLEDADQQRRVYDKKTGNTNACEMNEADRPEDDFFEVEDAGQGE